MEENDESINVKKIIIVEPEKKIKNKTTNTIQGNKNVSYEKIKKQRIETSTWGLNEEDLTHENQLNIIRCLNSSEIKTSVVNKYKNHIKTKISSYKQQDVLKKKYNELNFVSYNEVLTLLNECDMRCCYCSCEIYVLYEYVRETKQWTLDRINNDVGHNKGNLVISCLECNLKRRRTNKDAFMFTKNLVITKL